MKKQRSWFPKLSQGRPFYQTRKNQKGAYIAMEIVGVAKKDRTKGQCYICFSQHHHSRNCIKSPMFIAEKASYTIKAFTPESLLTPLTYQKRRELRL